MFAVDYGGAVPQGAFAEYYTDHRLADHSCRAAGVPAA